MAKSDNVINKPQQILQIYPQGNFVHAYFDILCCAGHSDARMISEFDIDAEGVRCALSCLRDLRGNAEKGCCAHTVFDAVGSLKKGEGERFVITVQDGVYTGRVEITTGRSKTMTTTFDLDDGEVLDMILQLDLCREAYDCLSNGDQDGNTVDLETMVKRMNAMADVIIPRDDPVAIVSMGLLILMLGQSKEENDALIEKMGGVEGLEKMFDKLRKLKEENE